MHQIIHLSPVGCFIPARGKTVQKNREVSGVKKYLLALQNAVCAMFGCNNSRNKPMHNLRSANICTYFYVSNIKCCNLTIFPLVIAILATTKIHMTNI